MFRIMVRQFVRLRLRLRCVGGFGLRLVALPTGERMFEPLYWHSDVSFIKFMSIGALLQADSNIMATLLSEEVQV